MTPAQKAINEETAKEIGEAVAVAVTAKLNGDKMPKDWREFLWMSGKTFGFASIVLCVAMGFAWKVLPPIVDAQVENINVQTKNIAKQSETLEELSDLTQQILECPRPSEEFAKTIMEDHGQQTEHHIKIVATLDKISEKLDN